MAIMKNKGSGVLLLALLVLALLVYTVPGLESFYSGLPQFVQVTLLLAATYGVAALVGYLKRPRQQKGGKKRKRRG